LLPPFFYTAVVSKKSPIYLVGLMGVGKSTVAARLAARLGRAFLDTDREVERVAGRTIAEIWEEGGEALFRGLESEALEAATAEGAVIALGGGAVAEPGAIARLLDSGEIVFLMADPDVLVDRIDDPASRPLLAGLDRAGQIEKLGMLLAERLPFYQQATIQIDARGKPEEVVERILDVLESR
jgi:shikimate kinase